MTQKPKAWQVEDDGGVRRLEETAPTTEKQIEDWIEQDSDIVAQDVLIIARQHTTGFGSVADLLALDSEGNLVVIELKRERTPRGTVAQSLEYAAWASRLGYEAIQSIAVGYYGSAEKFNSAFRDRFGTDLPEKINSGQRIIIVAPAVTDSVRTVIEYLAERFGVPISAVSFSLVQVESQRVLVREVVVDEEVPEQPTRLKRRPAPTVEELLDQARENGVGAIAEYLLALKSDFGQPLRYRNGWGHPLKLGSRRLSLFGVFPTGATKAGAVVISITERNLAELFNRPIEQCRAFVKKLAREIGHPEPRLWPEWERFSLVSLDEARRFVHALTEFTGYDLGRTNRT